MSQRLIITLVVVLLSLDGELLAAASQQGPQAVEQALAEALQLVQTGRFSDALDPLRRLNTHRPRGHLTPVWERRLPFLLGLAYFQSGDEAKAILHFERARESYPELLDYTLWYLGEGLRRLDRVASSRTAFQWLLDAFPTSVHRDEALFRLAEANARLGDRQRATELYSRYQREYPEGVHRGEVIIGLGLVQRDLGNAAAALREWRNLWVEHPEDSAAVKVPDLEKTLSPALVVPGPTPEEWYRRAQRLYQLNRFREALQSFSLAQTLSAAQPVSLDILYQIGMCQYHVRDNAAAVETFERIYASTPSGPHAPAALLMRARLYLRTESDENFLSTAHTLIERFPSSKQADEIGYLTGHFYRNRGRVTEAARAFQQIVDRGKTSEYADDAWWYLGWLQFGTGESERAAQTWGRLLSAFPASGLVPDTLYWQGRALERSGRQAEARMRYERVRSSYQQSFYGYLATARLEVRSPWAWDASQLNGSTAGTVRIPTHDKGFAQQ